MAEIDTKLLTRLQEEVPWVTDKRVAGALQKITERKDRTPKRFEYLRETRERGSWRTCAQAWAKHLGSGADDDFKVAEPVVFRGADVAVRDEARLFAVLERLGQRYGEFAAGVEKARTVLNAAEKQRKSKRDDPLEKYKAARREQAPKRGRFLERLPAFVQNAVARKPAVTVPESPEAIIEATVKLLAVAETLSAKFQASAEALRTGPAALADHEGYIEGHARWFPVHEERIRKTVERLRTTDNGADPGVVEEYVRQIRALAKLADSDYRSTSGELSWQVVRNNLKSFGGWGPAQRQAVRDHLQLMIDLYQDSVPQLLTVVRDCAGTLGLKASSFDPMKHHEELLTSYQTVLADLPAARVDENGSNQVTDAARQQAATAPRETLATTTAGRAETGTGARAASRRRAPARRKQETGTARPTKARKAAAPRPSPAAPPRPRAAAPPRRQPDPVVVQQYEAVRGNFDNFSAWLDQAVSHAPESEPVLHMQDEIYDIAKRIRALTFDPDGPRLLEQLNALALLIGQQYETFDTAALEQMASTLTPVTYRAASQTLRDLDNAYAWAEPVLEAGRILAATEEGSKMTWPAGDQSVRAPFTAGLDILSRATAEIGSQVQAKAHQCAATATEFLKKLKEALELEHATDFADLGAFVGVMDKAVKNLTTAATAVSAGPVGEGQDPIGDVCTRAVFLADVLTYDWHANSTEKLVPVEEKWGEADTGRYERLIEQAAIAGENTVAQACTLNNQAVPSEALDWLIVRLAEVLELNAATDSS